MSKGGHATGKNYQHADMATHARKARKLAKPPRFGEGVVMNTQEKAAPGSNGRGLRSVDIHRSAISELARQIIALKLQSDLSYRVAMRRNSLM